MRIAKPFLRLVGLFGFGLLLGLTAHAQTPQLVNAKVETRAAEGNFSAQLGNVIRDQQQPAWIGYSVPAVAGNHQMCCGTYYDDGEMNGCGVCRLEGENDGTSVQSNRSTSEDKSQTVKLEGPEQLVVLLRAEHGTVGRIRTFSEDCQLDAGGLPVIWFTNVSGAQSVAALTPFATSGDDTREDRSGQSALSAIAVTGDPSAEHALEGFVASNQPGSLREHAAFWLGAARGHEGYEVLQKLAREDSSDDLRAKVAFDLYVSHDPAATDEIIHLAKNDRSSHVREQAIFWVAQKAGQRAAAAINEAIENDPDTEVKKRAVFALSQLPREQGVPLLIQVAKTNANPAVRKQAIFWLGQSHDPRALAFFEEILAR
ncbi:MAG TPA: HEAT repeat domain-containing protein [Candidatus Acidoferrales bacterium]|nr:HEAT repeat domain-containing protein [Candidatus Acidoferrales bacterium]